MLFAVNLAMLAISLGTNSGQSPRRTETHPPVILISIDTLRADHLGIYGYRSNPTPHIDSFGEHGTVFTQIDSQIPLTLPSHTCLFTSTYPFQNGVEENAEIVPPNLLTLASVLREHGYETGAFIGSTLLSKRYGLDRGFDTYDSPFRPQGEQMVNPYSMSVRRDGALVTRSALSWLADKQGRPVFAFLHLFDLHTPYAVRQFSAMRLVPNQPGYDAEIRYVDQVLGHLKDALTRSGWWSRAVVIVLSDHGESLGDHGETSHGYFAYESTLHVPLIIHWPASSGNHPERVDEPAGLMDVAPTLLGFLHIAAPASFVGRDLLDGSRRVQRPVYSETMYAHDAFHWAALRRLRVLNREYIDAPRPELYDLGSDPAERSNIAQAHAQEAQSFRAQLRSLLAQYSAQHREAVADKSSESQAALRSLGYLAGGAPARSNAGLDPKDGLAEYQAYERALTALYSDETNVAARRFRDLLTKFPENTLARYYLGETYVKLGRWESALQEWRAAIAHDHTYEPAAVAMGDLYLLLGSPLKARDAFEAATTLSPGDYDAHFKLGAAEEQLGQLQEAKRHIETACKLAYDDAAECRRSLAGLKAKLHQRE